MRDNILYQYQNGDFNIIILKDGTKIREWDEKRYPIPLILYPESMDVKITDQCNLNCSYCHEQSTKDGKHCDINKLFSVLDEANFPKGIELALGGGNPLSHPHIRKMLNDLHRRGFICNITVNQKHLKQYESLIVDLIRLDLIKGLGISIINDDYSVIKKLQKITNNIVFHLIVGINPLLTIDELMKLNYCKILLLGYKTFGRGVNYYGVNRRDVLEGTNDYRNHLHSYIGKCLLSFDNLAIEQLNIKKWFTKEGWDKFYMGDDFTFTMYIDAVKQEYAPTSRSEKRIKFSETTLINFFKNRK